MKFINKQEKFSIRKYKSLGAASAVIGALVFHSGIVSAHESDVPVVEKIIRHLMLCKARVKFRLNRKR